MVHVELLALEAKSPLSGLKCEVNVIILNCTNNQKRKKGSSVFSFLFQGSKGKGLPFVSSFFFFE